MDPNQLIQSAIEAVVSAMGLEPLNDEQLAQLVAQVSERLQAGQGQANGGGEGATMSAEHVQSAFAKTAFLAEVMTLIKNVQIAGALPATIKANVTSLLGQGGQSQLGGYHNPNGAAGGNGQNNKHPFITLKTAYEQARLTAEDMSYIMCLQNLMRRTKGYQTPWHPDMEFYREFADKAGKAYNEGLIHLDEIAIKAINGIKADELNHSTLVGGGDEFVPDLWASQIWERSRLDNVILPLFTVVEMPSNPFELPIEGADPTVYYVPETTNEEQMALDNNNNPIPESKVGTGKVTLTARKFGIRVGYSSEIEEDSIIAWAPQARQQAMRAMEDALDNAILNGDTAASGNINLNGGAPAATAIYLAHTGLRKVAIANAKTVDMGNADPSLVQIRAARFKLLNAYASRPGDLVFLTHTEAYAKLLSMEEFMTMEKVGPKATVLTGQIGMIDGLPVLVTNELGLQAADGKISSTPGSNTRGSLVCIHKPSHYVGYRRRVAVSVEYLPYYDSYQLTATVRLAFTNRDTQGVSLLHNIAV